MNSHRFFRNNECKYFPCHKTENDEEFNCMFCYCPLYPAGEECGGNYIYLENGIKSCENCFIPHDKNGYEYIQAHMEKITKNIIP
ncbi:MAG: metal-binding protein [Oscillospiraceae bacterium]|nr:metal-binding protein [Oscillospiraceae bacterium]